MSRSHYNKGVTVSPKKQQPRHQLIFTRFPTAKDSNYLQVMAPPLYPRKSPSGLTISAICLFVKWIATRLVLSIVFLLSTNKDVKYYLDPIDALRPRARGCYQEVLPIALTNQQFVEMLLLDGCFILEIIRGHNIGFEQLGYPLDDPVFTRKGYNNMASYIIKDMIKLENQIPFFVLEKLFELQNVPQASGEIAHHNVPQTAGKVTQLAAFMFIKWLTGEALKSTQLNGEFLHCLHVFQCSLLLDTGVSQASLNGLDEASMTRSNHVVDNQSESATDLMEYGIVFKRPKNVKRPFWDIKFEKKGVLEIPRIFINNRFKVTLQNLIMFEQLSKRVNGYNQLRPMITEYVIFMDKLINSATDVGHLQQAGIIVHQLRSDGEVANLFNELGKAAFFDPRVTSYYLELYQDLNVHHSRWNQWKSELRRTYFGNPWAMASVFAASVLLVLAFLQTFFTIYPYYRPKSR